MMSWGNHMGAGGWIFAILGTLIIIGLIVALIVWAVSPRGDHTSADAPGGSPQEILDRRLASGELSAEQYQQLRETLGDASPPTRGSRPEARAGAVN